MKIISGIYRGIKIDTAKDVSYRPTKSRVRKSIFDVISPFDFSSVLDLFSGTGILGFESISRGASSITFVEKDAKSIRLLHRNSEKFEGVPINIIKNKVELFLKNIFNSILRVSCISNFNCWYYCFCISFTSFFVLYQNFLISLSTKNLQKRKFFN